MKKSILTLGLGLLAATNLFSLPSVLGKTDYKSSAVSHLDFNLSWENLIIQKTNSSSNVLVEVYCNKRRFAPTVKLSGSTLLIESAPSKIHFFFYEKKECSVIVSIPEGKEFDKVNIILSSGDIEQIDQLYASQINIQTSSGNMENINNLNAKLIDLQSSSGEMKHIDQLKASQISIKSSSGNQKEISRLQADSITVTASSGNIFVDQILTKDAKLTTTSGNINIQNLDCTQASLSASSGNIKVSDGLTKNITLKATSGTISAKNLLADSFDVSTSSGTIGFELKDAPVSNSSISTASGTLLLSMPKNSPATIKASTSSGSFVNAFTKEKIGSHADYKNSINGGGPLISLSSSSGNITLDVGDGISTFGRGSQSAAGLDDDSQIVSVDRPIF